MIALSIIAIFFIIIYLTRPKASQVNKSIVKKDKQIIKQQALQKIIPEVVQDQLKSVQQERFQQERIKLNLELERLKQEKLRIASRHKTPSDIIAANKTTTSISTSSLTEVLKSNLKNDVLAENLSKKEENIEILKDLGLVQVSDVEPIKVLKLQEILTSLANTHTDAFNEEPVKNAEGKQIISEIADFYFQKDGTAELTSQNERPDFLIIARTLEDIHIRDYESEAYNELIEQQNAFGADAGETDIDNAKGPIIYGEMISNVVNEELIEQENIYQGVEITDVADASVSPVFDETVTRNSADTIIEEEILSEKSEEIIDVDQSISPIIYDDINVSTLNWHGGVPPWDHHYVYSASEIKSASPSQKDFYVFYKACFLKNQFVNLDGYTNYGFILLYDLRQEYFEHEDFNLLKEQYKNLAIWCPKTEPYGRSFLIGKMREFGDEAGLQEMQWRTSSIDNRPEHQMWNWRSVYKEKLNLDDVEFKLLSDIYISSNTFTNIDFFACELIKLYLAICKSLTAAYGRKGLKRDEQFKIILDVLARKQYRYHLNSSNYKYVTEQSVEVYRYILKYAEKLLRECYNYKRKINIDQIFLHPDIVVSFNENVLSFIEDKLPSLLSEVAPIDENTELELNKVSPSRWKDKYELMVINYKEKGKECFLEELQELIKLNAKNPSLENIYFEASKFFVNTDKQLSLINFLMYVRQNLISKTLVLKSFPKAIQKQLFTDELQAQRFENVKKILMQNLDLSYALKQIEGFYLPVRKKIKLDTEFIKQVEELDHGTIIKLNELLADDDNNRAIEHPEAPSEGAVKQILVNSTCFDSSLSLTVTEIEFLNLFKLNDFKLIFKEVDMFCAQIGAMRTPLVNNINEKCFELLDDLLIEENEHYSIIPNYYNKLLTI